MTSELQSAEWLYDLGLALEKAGIKYSKGAGHGRIDPVKGPYGMWLPPTQGEQGIGYDCSSYATALLWHSGLFGDSYTYVPDTHELENWGAAGTGKYVTLRVFDGLLPIVNGFWIEHCFIEVTGLGPERPNALFAAQYPGTVVGKFTASPEWVDAFHPRHAA